MAAAGGLRYAPARFPAAAGRVDSDIEVLMRVHRAIVGFCCVLASAAVMAAERAGTSPDWLIGTWVLCEDPDGSPKDSLRFNADGTGLVIRDAGDIEFVHSHSGQSVSLIADPDGHAIPIELSSSAAFDQLLLHSDRTGNTSHYVRSDSAGAAACGIQ